MSLASSEMFSRNVPACTTRELENRLLNVEAKLTISKLPAELWRIIFGMIDSRTLYLALPLTCRTTYRLVASLYRNIPVDYTLRLDLFPDQGTSSICDHQGNCRNHSPQYEGLSVVPPPSPPPPDQRIFNILWPIDSSDPDRPCNHRLSCTIAASISWLKRMSTSSEWSKELTRFLQHMSGRNNITAFCDELSGRNMDKRFDIKFWEMVRALGPSSIDIYGNWPRKLTVAGPHTFPSVEHLNLVLTDRSNTRKLFEGSSVLANLSSLQTLTIVGVVKFDTIDDGEMSEDSDEIDNVEFEYNNHTFAVTGFPILPELVHLKDIHVHQVGDCAIEDMSLFPSTIERLHLNNFVALGDLVGRLPNLAIIMGMGIMASSLSEWEGAAANPLTSLRCATLCICSRESGVGFLSHVESAMPSIAFLKVAIQLEEEEELNDEGDVLPRDKQWWTDFFKGFRNLSELPAPGSGTSPAGYRTCRVRLMVPIEVRDLVDPELVGDVSEEDFEDRKVVFEVEE
ncbi:hypothetical protein M427DRAFT_56797 [Gonapodya prolifera JEL478]|uniref:F-box domain-containing protein n=1 Tax=Gonapodya prolifera (strain JEL478) TaxID=1344416 RepID=A0A139AF64_GONPJ|nr:hypothetical protein M427DRAFT_56797 [Gonapodya prolifera JEL478]|eukprot:KXS15456.1 hypothetical protein M427DRAFT_56797 [Gonapodya prolifera JEL478]